MDNTTCKWVAIVGIIVAVLIVLWILAAIIRCCCLGVACCQAICCCCSCCCPGGGPRYRDGGNESYKPGYPPSQPTVVHNHYTTAEPTYGQVTDFPDESQKYSTPASVSGGAPGSGPGFLGMHSGGYQKLNDANNMEMASMPPSYHHQNNNSNMGYEPSSYTAYNPNQTGVYDNTYDHHNGGGMGNNADFYNPHNRF